MSQYGSMFDGGAVRTVPFLAGDIEDGVTDCNEEYWQGKAGIGGTTAYYWIQAIAEELAPGVSGTYSDVSARLTAITGDYLPRSGALPMTGDLDMNGQSINSISAINGKYLTLEAPSPVLAIKSTSSGSRSIIEFYNHTPTLKTEVYFDNVDNVFSITNRSTDGVRIDTNLTQRILIAGSGAITFNQAYTFPTADGSVNYVMTTNGSGVITWSASSSGSVTGTGTAGKIPKWSTTTALTDSVLVEDSGNIGIGVTPSTIFHILGSASEVLRLESSSTNSIYSASIDLYKAGVPTQDSTTVGGIAIRSKDQSGNDETYGQIYVTTSNTTHTSEASLMGFQVNVVGAPTTIFEVLTTGTKTTGVHNATTGYQINGGATSNAIMRGNGTNFVSAAAEALTKVDDTNVTLTLGGTPASSLINAASLTLGWAGTLSVTRGGTGASTLTGVLKGNGTSAISAMTGTAGKIVKWSDANTLSDSVVVEDSGKIGINVSPSTTLHVYGASGYTTARVEANVTDQYLAYPTVSIYKSGTPGQDATFQGSVTFDGKDKSGNAENYGTILCGTTNTTHTSEASYLSAYVNIAGTPTEKLLINSAGIKATGIVNATTGYQVNDAATSGNVLRGDGTNFISAVLGGSDITGAALTKGDDTNVTLTLGGTPTTALLRAASITAGWAGQLSLARGGSAANLTAVHGGLIYSTASAFAISAAGSSGQILKSAGAAAPTWNTAGALTKTDDTNVTLTLGGSASTALVNAASLTLGWAGTLEVARGGSGTGTAFTTGSVIFAGASGVYSQDNANFFWDDANKRLGIGTTSPSYGLDVSGGGAIGVIRVSNSNASARLRLEGAGGAVINKLAASDLYFGETTDTGKYVFRGTGDTTIQGNVGIGTTGPDGKLNIWKGDSGATAETYANTLVIEDSGGNGGLSILSPDANTAQIVWGSPSDSNYAEIRNFYNAGSPYQSFRVSNSEKVRITNAGNVGIGTTLPKSKLDVEGGVAIGATYSGTTAAPSNGLIIEGNVGINSTAPARKLEVLDASAPQMRLTYTASSVYTDFLTASTGKLSITPSGAEVDVIGSTIYLTHTVPEIRIRSSSDGSNQSLLSFYENTSAPRTYLYHDNFGTPAFYIWNPDSRPIHLYTNNLVRMSIAGAGGITFNNAYTFPTADGTNGYALVTNGSGAVAWTAIAAGIGGSGTANYIAKFSAETTIADSAIQESGGSVGINSPPVSSIALAVLKNASTASDTLIGAQIAPASSAGGSNPVISVLATPGTASEVTQVDAYSVVCQPSPTGTFTNWYGIYLQPNVLGTVTNKYAIYAAANSGTASLLGGSTTTLQVAPSVNDTYTSGTSSLRWSNVYSVLGDFTGEVLVTAAGAGIQVRDTGTAESTISFNKSTTTGVGWIQTVNSTNAMTLGSISGILGLYANSTLGIVIDTGGNVGIGTSAIDARLDVRRSNAGECIRMYNTGTDSVAKIVMSNDARTFDFWVDGGDSDKWKLYDQQGAAARITVNTSGDVGIGTVTPDCRLHVAKNYTGGPIIQSESTITSGNGGTLKLMFSGSSPNNTTSYFIGGEDSTQARFVIYSNGAMYNNGTYATLSDARLKTNIIDARSYWDDFKKLQYHTYNMKNGGERCFGLVAQELLDIFPSLVSMDGRTGYLSIKSSIVHEIGMSVLVEAQNKIDDLYPRMETLEGKVKRLESEVEELKLKLAA